MHHFRAGNEIPRQECHDSRAKGSYHRRATSSLPVKPEDDGWKETSPVETPAERCESNYSTGWI